MFSNGFVDNACNSILCLDCCLPQLRAAMMISGGVMTLGVHEPHFRQPRGNRPDTRRLSHQLTMRCSPSLSVRDTTSKRKKPHIMRSSTFFVCASERETRGQRLVTTFWGVCRCLAVMAVPTPMLCHADEDGKQRPGWDDDGSVWNLAGDSSADKELLCFICSVSDDV